MEAKLKANAAAKANDALRRLMEANLEAWRCKLNGLTNP